MGFKLVVNIPSTYKFIGLMVDSFELDKGDSLVDGVRILKWKEREYDQTDFNVISTRTIEKKMNVSFLSVDGLVIFENT